MRKKKTVKPIVERAADVPVTQKMLYGVREELRSDIRSLEFKMEARFSGLDSKFSGIDSKFSSLHAKFSEIDSRFSSFDARFNSIDSRFQSQDARFNSIDSKLEKLSSDIHQMKILFEEQNAKNNIVLDGLSSLFQRQERVEGELVDVQKTLITVRRP